MVGFVTTPLTTRPCNLLPVKSKPICQLHDLKLQYGRISNWSTVKLNILLWTHLNFPRKIRDFYLYILVLLRLRSGSQAKYPTGNVDVRNPESQMHTPLNLSITMVGLACQSHQVDIVTTTYDEQPPCNSVGKCN